MDQNVGSDEGTSTVALSVADYCGTTIAVHKMDSRDYQWQTIGSNLIAYWTGDSASIRCYFDALAQPDTQVVRVRELMSLNERSKNILPLDNWTGGTVTVAVRDRLVNDDLRNLLMMEISKTSISMELITKTSTAMGTAASSALEVLTNYHSLISTNAFDTDEKLREHIVSKAIVGAVTNNDSYNGQGEIVRGSDFVGWKSLSYNGYCEIIRGSSTEGWKSLSMIPMNELVAHYSPRLRFMSEEECSPYTSYVVSYINNREALPKEKSTFSSNLDIIKNPEDLRFMLQNRDRWKFHREVITCSARY